MIRYSLNCTDGHVFESWFQNSAAFDKQKKRGLVTCPICGSGKVEKAIMAPKLVRTDIERPPAPMPLATTAGRNSGKSAGLDAGTASHAAGSGRKIIGRYYVTARA